MPNKYYIRSRTKEYDVKKQGEKEGWFSARMAGSHGIADVVWIRPHEIGQVDSCFEVKFIQIKVSKKFKQKEVVPIKEKTPFGVVEVEHWRYPAKK